MEKDINKKREKFLALLTAILISSIFVYTSILEPQFKKQKSLKAELSNLEIQLTKLKADLTLKDRVDEMYSQVQPLISIAGSQQQKISAFTRELNDIYSKLGVTIKAVKILPPSNENYYHKLAIKIDINGGIKEFLKFANAIEKHPKPIKIEQFNIKAQETKDKVNVSMLISKVVSENGKQI